MSDQKPPNFIIFMTDQQRSTQLFPEFPEEWVKKHLPNYQYFLDNGVVFDNNICNTSPCGPSRASLFTGQYPANNGIKNNSGSIKRKDMNFVRVLRSQNYDIYYKGKMHLNDETTKFSQTWTNDPNLAGEKAKQENGFVENLYGIKKWTSPDFGTLLAEANPSVAEMATLAGGSGHNDSRVVTGEYKLYQEQESVLSFLKDVQENPPENPFCLIVSLVNPHDISLYPLGWFEAGYQSALFNGPDFDDIGLPKSYTDTLETKPRAQAAYLNTRCNGKLVKTTTSEGSVDYPLNYLKFYAYLHRLSDGLLGTVMDSIGKELMDNSVMIRMADHGEMAMSHGGLKEKNNSMYNETIRVPMIWMHPSFKPGKRDQLVSLIDLIPTMGAVAGSDLSECSKLQGVDYSAALYSDEEKVQDGLIFTFNQQGPAMSGTAPTTVDTTESIVPRYESNKYGAAPNAPTTIYALVKKEWKYAVYYDLDKDGNVNWEDAQYEMYNLKEDWIEMINLLPVDEDVSEENAAIAASLHEELTNLMVTREIEMPEGWRDRP